MIAVYSVIYISLTLILHTFLELELYT